jgi:hypothetical protein
VDAGTALPVATDFDGNIRPINGTCDIGAFEFSNSAVKGFRDQRGDPALLLPMVQNPISPAILRRFLQDNETVALYDCTGKRLLTEQVDRQGTYIVKDRAAGRVQRIFVIK